MAYNTVVSRAKETFNLDQLLKIQFLNERL